VLRNTVPIHIISARIDHKTVLLLLREQMGLRPSFGMRWGLFCSVPGPACAADTASGDREVLHTHPHGGAGPSTSTRSRDHRPTGSPLDYQSIQFNVRDGALFLVMDWHGSLRRRYPRVAWVPQSTFLCVETKMAAALQYAHDKVYSS